jgi:O-antigen ligase
MRVLDSSRFRTWWAALSLFTLLAGDAWRYSISWWGFSAVAVILFTIGLLLLVRQRDRWSLASLPLPLLAFLALATLSLIWSQYRGASALGITSTWVTVITAVSLAITLPWSDLLRILANVLRFILAASIAFELFVSLVIRHPILPFWVHYEGDPSTFAKQLFWSRDLILDGGKIQGITGNSALLAFVALLGLIVFGVQLAAGKIKVVWGIFWFALAAAIIVMTWSATITVAIGVLIAMVIAVVILRLSRNARTTAILYVVIGAALVVLATLALVFRDTLLAAMGKSSDLTGRADIWNVVIGLAQQHPIHGWGWVSYWVPWVEPFKGLIVKGGVVQLHAHNAWLDLWLQLGIIGVLVFAALVVYAAIRAWFAAVDRPQLGPDQPARYTAESLLPLLLIMALLSQSLVESRLLVEYGLTLLVIVAVKTKRGDTIPVEVLPQKQRVPRT